MSIKLEDCYSRCATKVAEKSYELGILVTTSNYGEVSYSYIKDKQITLINGNEVLGMFNELGYHNMVDY